MPDRNRYPVPQCPKCGKYLNKVKQTVYSADDDIVRRRMCDICQHRWWTVQKPESNLNPETSKVYVPGFRNGANRAKKCKLFGEIYD